MASKGTLINPGDVVQDRYQILHQMDSGEFGNTYLAEDVELKNKRYVLKKITPQLTEVLAQEKAQEIFEKELGIFFCLQHSQIPKYRELLRYQKGRKQCLLLVRDYVRGNTYKQLLNQRLKENQKFKEIEIEVLLKNILPILGYCHSNGVIHCNIAPENIILREEDQLPVLVNFGCIKKAEKQLLSQANNKVTVNTTLPFVGTALEIAGFAPREQVDKDTAYAHNDLYALAATAVVLLTGKEPRELVDLPQYRWNWRSEININPRLEWLLNNMLSPDPTERLSSAEVMQILDNISFKSSSPTFSGENVGDETGSLTKQHFFLPALKAQIKSFSPPQFSPRAIIQLSLVSIGLFITYAYPKQLENLFDFSVKIPRSENLPNSLMNKNLSNSAISKHSFTK